MTNLVIFHIVGGVSFINNIVIMSKNASLRTIHAKKICFFETCGGISGWMSQKLYYYSIVRWFV